MSDNYAKACSEVLTIIPHIEQKYSEKIPYKFIKMLEIISDKEYINNINIDFSKKLKEQKLLEETRIILALIYRDYLCSEEEKEKLILQEQEEWDRIEKEKHEKYNIDFEKISDNRKQKKIDAKLRKNEKLLIEIKEEKWYHKIINKILKLFKHYRKG